jgi:DNA-binding NtrC family response regulator
MGKSVLVVEDDDILADNIGTYLRKGGWQVHISGTGEDALRVLDQQRPEIVLTDHMLPGMTGVDLVGHVLAIDPQIKVVVLTGDGSVQTAVDAMKAGAYDYLTKPIVLAELDFALKKAIGASTMERAIQFYQERESRGSSLDELVGESPLIVELKQRVRQILGAERNVPGRDLPAILITGETGTGKGLVARSLHVDGVRRTGPLVEVNCASIPSTLLEAELFGHERGAFTDAKDRRMGLVESADGGTLFLDEIGEVDMSIQGKLLKLLEDKSVRRIGSVRERRVNLRLISATNRDLEAMIRDGRFRSDLFFRLRIITVHVPPLRARGNDVLLLAQHFLEVLGKRYGKRDLVFSADAKRVLTDDDWPGNVRELRNLLEETVLLARSNAIEADQLALCRILKTRTRNDPADDDGAPSALVRELAVSDEDDRDLVMQMLKRTDWNVSKTAKLLGMSRDTLRYRIEKYGLLRPRE